MEEGYRQGGATSAHVEPIVIELGEDDTSESDLSGVEPLEEV